MSAAGGPIFVVGSNGSGSTLLRLMLDSHPNIAIPEETGFLRLAAMHRWVPYWKLGGDWYRNLGLTEAELHQALAGFYGDLFASYASSRGKARWGDKTPFHVWHMELATQMYPDAVVVGIVRHPAASVNSIQRRFRRGVRAGWKHWRRSTRQLLHAGALLGDRFVLLRYEDLVTDPERTMRALLESVGEPWSDTVLAHHEVQPTAESTGFTRTDRPVDTESLAGWTTELKGPALERVAKRTGKLAAFLGYDPRTPVPTEALGTPLLTGTALAARQRDRGAAIEWVAPHARAEDRMLRPPPPRRRARQPDLSRITHRDLIRHRFASRLSPDQRRALGRRLRKS